MKIALLQLNSFDYSRLKDYFALCSDEKVELIIISDYTAMPFYKDIVFSEVAKEYDKILDFFATLHTKYKVNIVLPYVRIDKGRLYKSTYIYRVDKKVKVVDNSILMDYPHWDEREVFSNEFNKEITTFTINNFRATILTGIELHYDFLLAEANKKRVDLIISPTSSTFDSNRRWRELYKTRAFLNGCYVIRTNRLGSSNGWKFYGESMVITPYGKVKDIAVGNEELLIENIDKSEVVKARRDFKFYLKYKESK